MRAYEAGQRFGKRHLGATTRPTGEQRDSGEAKEDFDRAFSLAGDLKNEGFLGDMVVRWGDLANGT